MGKSGHSSKKGIMHGDNVTAEELIQEMKEQASQVVSQGYVANLKLSSNTPEGRPYVMITVMDSQVKKYLTERDLKHYSPDQIRYEKAFTESDKKKLGHDFKMPAIED